MSRKYILKEKFMIGWTTDISIMKPVERNCFDHNFANEMKKPGIWKLIFVLSYNHYIATRRVAIETNFGDIILIDTQQPVTIERRYFVSERSADFSGAIFHFNKKPTEDEAERVIKEHLEKT